jgi:putative acetyltransferase
MKSVYLTPAARGRGLGLVIVRRLETAAHELGYNEVRLETGTRSPSAVKTYERAGYEHCRRFGAYPENESSVFMMKRLTSGDASAAPNWPEPHGRHETEGEPS